MQSEFAPFVSLIESKYSLSSEATQAWLDIMELRQYKKGSFFAKANDITSNEVYVLKGFMRVYYQVEKKQKNSAFFGKGQFVMPWQTRTVNSRSMANFQFIENTTVLVFNAEKFTALRFKFKELQKIGESILEQEFNRLKNREIELLGMSAAERFELFCKEHADFLNQLSQYHIASYLNISPVSLSKMKLEWSKK